MCSVARLLCTVKNTVVKRPSWIQQANLLKTTVGVFGVGEGGRGTEPGLRTKNLRAKVLPLLRASLQFESSNRRVQQRFQKCVPPELCPHTVCWFETFSYTFVFFCLWLLLIANYALADPRSSDVIGLDKREAREENTSLATPRRPQVGNLKCRLLI